MFVANTLQETEVAARRVSLTGRIHELVIENETRLLSLLRSEEAHLYGLEAAGKLCCSAPGPTAAGDSP